MFNSRVLLLLVAACLLQACGGADNSSTVPETNATAPQIAEETVEQTVEQTAEQATASPAQAQLTITDVKPAPADPTASTYQDLQGNPLELSAYAGKKIFLNYWATWCAPCIREIPSIARAAEILEDENYVFLLASDESLETISEFLEDRGFIGNFIKLNGFFGGHGIDAVPSSVLFDETGAMVKTWPGDFEWDSPEMLAELREAK
jgi:thiol-disulfide isomerase/thioredoxin